MLTAAQREKAKVSCPTASVAMHVLLRAAAPRSPGDSGRDGLGGLPEISKTYIFRPWDHRNRVFLVARKNPIW